MKKVLVTGINGFVGKHLTRELHKNGVLVVGIGREDALHSEISELVEEYHVVDLATTWPEIKEVDAVIHLAGLAAVGPSFDHPQDYITINSAMLTHMAEFYLKQAKRPRILVVSSGAIYDPAQAMPLTEASALGFSSPYAVSKVLVENQCKYYSNRGLQCVVIRPFNHTGPGQLEGFLVPDVIAQLQNGDSLTVGNITTKRDYTDVRDIASAYYLLATTPELNHDIYNACSGRSISGEEIIETLKKLARKPDISVEVDQSKVRPTDPEEIYGDNSALRADTGWSPVITLEQTLQDCLNS